MRFVKGTFISVTNTTKVFSFSDGCWKSMLWRKSKEVNEKRRGKIDVYIAMSGRVSRNKCLVDIHKGVKKYSSDSICDSSSDQRRGI